MVFAALKVGFAEDAPGSSTLRVGSRRALDNDASSARLGEWRTHKMLAPNQKTHDVLSAGGPFCFIIPRFAEAAEKLTAWCAEGKLVWQVDVREGFENAPKTFLRLFSGANVGKQLLKL